MFFGVAKGVIFECANEARKKIIKTVAFQWHHGVKEETAVDKTTITGATIEI